MKLCLIFHGQHDALMHCALLLSSWCIHATLVSNSGVTRQWRMHAAWRPYGVNTLMKGHHDAPIQCRAALVHHNKIKTLRHYAAPNGLNNVKRYTLIGFIKKIEKSVCNYYPGILFLLWQHFSNNNFNGSAVYRQIVVHGHWEKLSTGRCSQKDILWIYIILRTELAAIQCIWFEAKSYVFITGVVTYTIF